MPKQKAYVIADSNKTLFENKCTYCVGTGRLGLALQKEYYDQLKMAQKEAGFSFIRGHGIFCDDIGIYNEYEDAGGVVRPEYNFTYLDRIFDGYLSLGIKPFIELGFMPKKMASGEKTIFYWQGNVTPPADYDKWTDLVKNLLTHLIERYGHNEVATWPVEVWNEPNLAGFWQNADMDEYKKLYSLTAHAVKEVSGKIRVGGPAICGGENSIPWMKGFLDYCRETKAPLDFFTRHLYMANMPERNGRYIYHTMRGLQYTFDELRETRNIIDSYDEYRGMELHITEFSTSYHPFCPIHDTNLNAAYIAGLISTFGDMAASYSYWTFGDVFEEQGVPHAPFHGGFGLVANGCIPKPTLWTFAFFKRLNGILIHRSEDLVIVKCEDGCYRGVCWNLCDEKREPLNIEINLSVEKGEYILLRRTVDEEVCNPLKAWHDMGEPSSLTDAQKSFLISSAYPANKTKTQKCEDGFVELSLELKENAVVYLELQPLKRQGDRGYDYDWYLRQPISVKKPE